MNHIIQYKILAEENGVTLKIWEPITMTQMRTAPFLFALNYRLASKELAWFILNDYLKVAGAKGLDYGRMSDEGSIRVEVHPTMVLA